MIETLIFFPLKKLYEIILLEIMDWKVSGFRGATIIVCAILIGAYWLYRRND